MATFVQIEPDAFNQQSNKLSKGLGLQHSRDPDEVAFSRSALYHHVRRPVRGIQIKNDTYGIIQVRRADGVNLPLFDAGNPSDTGRGPLNSNFLIQSVAEQRAEKQQIILTFGEPYIFFFGEQPRQITVSGVLLNTEDFNWRAEWWANYEQFLRGTQCVRNRARVYLSWDDIVVEGYVTQATANEDASNNSLVQFQFQMFLTNYQNISNIGDIDAHWKGKVIDLDPSLVDLPGTSDTVSNTALVRQRNVESEQLASGQGSDSLIDYLRNPDAASSRVVELQGQLVDVLSLAGQFVSGRNIRVPIGFAGAAAFDQEVQLAINSIPGAASIINGTDARTITFNTGGLNLVKEFRAALGAKFGKARVGLHLSANEDEYVARMQYDDTGAQKFVNLFNSQLATTDAAIEQVKEVYKAFNVDTDPSSDISTLIANRAFGVAIVTAGTVLVQDSSTTRAFINGL